MAVVFDDRAQVARLLAERLKAYAGRNPLVLAIPRGGVPMGRIIADALGGELDVVLVHKLGAPGNPEFAIGSVDESGRVALAEHTASLGIDPRFIEREAAAERELLRQRRERYGRPAANPKGRIVIVVDDGIATGSTLLAALAAVREQRPKRLIAAVGVAPPETVKCIEAEADELVCLEAPAGFSPLASFFATSAR